MWVSMDCEQIKWVVGKITDKQSKSEQSQGIADTDNLLLRKVQGALKVLQKKFQYWEFPQNSIILGDGPQNDTVGKWDLCFALSCMASKAGWAFRRRYISPCFDMAKLLYRQ